MVNTPPSGSTFAKGITIVTSVATDDHGPLSTILGGGSVVIHKD